MENPNFRFKDGNELLSSHSGTALVGLLLPRINLAQRLSAVELSGSPNPIISHVDIVTAMIGLLTIGKCHYDDIEQFREDPFFKKSLNLSHVPSSPTIRQRLDDAGSSFNTILKEEYVYLLQTLGRLSSINVGEYSYIPLDLDVTPMDNSNTKKEGVSYTYKGFDGYAPMMAYIGKEGYLVNLELRPGKQHSQSGTPSFLRETLQFARTITNETVLVRMDSGNDAADNIKIFTEENFSFIIKRNLRRESKEKWRNIAMEQGSKISLGGGRTRWIGKTERFIEGLEKPVSIIFDLVEKTQGPKGQMLITPDIEVETYWTNIDNLSAVQKIVLDESTGELKKGSASAKNKILDQNQRLAEAIINSYHAHGESEQFHSEFKTDMGLERMPSGKFETNTLILILGMMAYNILRLCGQESLKAIDHFTETNEPLPINRRKGVFRRRIRSVLHDIMFLASHITVSSRYTWISFGRCSPWSGIFKWLYQHFSNPVPLVNG